MRLLALALIVSWTRVKRPICLASHHAPFLPLAVRQNMQNMQSWNAQRKDKKNFELIILLTR